MFIFMRCVYFTPVCKVEEFHIFQEDQNNYSLVDTLCFICLTVENSCHFWPENNYVGLVYATCDPQEKQVLWRCCYISGFYVSPKSCAASKEISTGWRNELRGTSWSSIRGTSPAPGKEEPHAQIYGGGHPVGKQVCLKGLRVVVAPKLSQECVLVAQTARAAPGVLPVGHGRISFLLLSTCETASGVYCVQPQCRTGIGGRQKMRPRVD